MSKRKVKIKEQFQLRKKAKAILKIHKGFVGIPKLKEFHEKQIIIFEDQVKRKDFRSLNNSHFDWWLLPLNGRSMYRDLFTVSKEIVDELKKDQEFMELYRRGHQILALSWGWDLLDQKKLKKRTPEQKWYNWPVRLWKAGHSAFLFGERDIFISWLKFAKQLEKINKKLLICELYKGIGDFDIVYHQKYGWKGLLVRDLKEYSPDCLDLFDLINSDQHKKRKKK